MNKFKHSGLLMAAALAMTASAGLPPLQGKARTSPVKTRARRIGTHARTEIEAWNAAVDEQKAAKKARKGKKERP